MAASFGTKRWVVSDAKVTAKVSGPGRGGHPRAAHACRMQSAPERTSQQVQPLQRICTFLLVDPSLSRVPAAGRWAVAA
jgi:hypothetical protein